MSDETLAVRLGMAEKTVHELYRLGRGAAERLVVAEQLLLATIPKCNCNNPEGCESCNATRAFLHLEENPALTPLPETNMEQMVRDSRYRALVIRLRTIRQLAATKPGRFPRLIVDVCEGRVGGV